MSRYFAKFNTDPRTYRLNFPGSVPCEELPELRFGPEDAGAEQVDVQEVVSTLNSEQRGFFDDIISVLHSRGDGRAFFLDGPAGTGKAHVMKAVVASVRTFGSVVCMAWSGIAATLLPDGATVHSTLNLATKLDSTATVRWNFSDEKAKLLKNASMIVWDEISMASHHAVRAFDMFLRSITGVEAPFGNKLVVFCGDFRQILPVSKEGGAVLTVKNLDVWRRVKVYKLKTNVRVRENKVAFSKLLLDIGDGVLDIVSFPRECCVPDLRALINSVFSEPGFLTDGSSVILAPTNRDVDKINEIVSQKTTGASSTYLSHDEIDEGGCWNNYLEGGLPVEILNSMDPPGVPKHKLVLKVNQPVMLMRNLDVTAGLCNGTRLLIVKMQDNILICRVLVGPAAGKDIFIFRMRIKLDHEAFRFWRTQFPVRSAYAMTVHKSQGQTLQRVGLFLSRPVFAHGMLYVALSRVTSRENLYIFVAESPQQGSRIVAGEIVTPNYVLRDKLS